jgi:hypothetical protein
MFLGELLPVSLAFTSSRSAFRALNSSLTQRPFLRPPRRSPGFDPPRGHVAAAGSRPGVPQQPQLLTLRAHLKNSVIQNDLIASFTKLPVQGIEEIVRPQAADGV